MVVPGLSDWIVGCVLLREVMYCRSMGCKLLDSMIFCSDFSYFLYGM